jgi:tetrapyrrole methylase family protein/MazG family protein
MKRQGNKTFSRPLMGRGQKRECKSILEGVPDHSPSLSRAYHLTRRASRVGFDWPNIEGVLNKLDEEILEFREAIGLEDKRKIQEEIGDMLFVIANISRFLGIDPEEALKKTLKKFVSRFHYIEISLKKAGKPFRNSNLMEMDRLWEESKEQEKRSLELKGTAK